MPSRSHITSQNSAFLNGMGSRLICVLKAGIKGAEPFEHIEHRLTLNCYVSCLHRWSVVGHTALILPWMSPCHSQDVGVGTILTISNYLRSNVVTVVISHSCTVSPPRESSDRTTNGGTSQGEIWSSGIWVCGQLEPKGCYHEVSWRKVPHQKQPSLSLWFASQSRQTLYVGIARMRNIY